MAKSANKPPKIISRRSTGTKTVVRGLRDGQYTGGTGWLVRKIKALGAKVTVAATGRVTVVDKRGDRHVYVLALDPTVDNSPLTQALADLESLPSPVPHHKTSGQYEPQPQSSFIAELPKKSHAQIKREVDEILTGEAHAQKKTTLLKDIEPGLRNVAQRSLDAENRFIAYAMEHGRLSRGQAETALVAFRKARVIKFDAVNGTFHVTHGQFLEPDVLRRAAGIEE